MRAGATRSDPHSFYGWFVVAAAFAVTFVGFGCAYTFSAFVGSLHSRISEPRAARFRSCSRSRVFSISASAA
jgi:hypothetical protein